MCVRRRPRRDSGEATAAVGGRRAYQAVAGLWQGARRSCRRRGGYWRSCGARGGVNRGRASAGSGGLELAIRAAPASSGEIDGVGMLSEERGADGVKIASRSGLYL